MAASPRMVPDAPARFYRPELDALRFAAFSLVFLHHALPHSASEVPAWPRFLALCAAVIARAGAYGVDLFFALSAYLITELLLREWAATGSLDVGAFYKRRILRIWPLYFFALVVLAPAMAWLDPADALTVPYATGFALLSGNWVCAWLGYPASSFALLWSVSIEEQFYLAWPWLVRRNALHLRTFAWGMLGAAWMARLLLVDAAHPAVWCNTIARLDPIAAGILLAGAEAPRRRMIWLGGGLLGLLVAGALGEHSGWPSIWTYPLAAASAASLLYGSLGSGIGHAALGYLGKISFGMYVFHVAALKIAGSAVGGFALTVAAAAVSYRYLESPFLRWKERFARVGSRPV